MSRNAPLKELSFGGALRDIQKTAARETIRDLVGCSSHWATEDSMASKSDMWVFD